MSKTRRAAPRKVVIASPCTSRKLGGWVGGIASLMIVAVVLCTFLTLSAGADEFGELGRVGSFGEGTNGEFTYPSDMVVNPENNDVYVLDEPGATHIGAGPLSFRIQEFSQSLGKPIASTTVPTPLSAGGLPTTVDGLAFDKELKRLYVLIGAKSKLPSSSSYLWEASKIEMYSAETLQNEGVLYEFPTPPTEVSKITPEMLGTPRGIAVDPQHNVVVLGLDTAKSTKLQQITSPAPAHTAGKLEATFDDTTNTVALSGKGATGIAIGSGGEIYLSAQEVAPSGLHGAVKLSGGTFAAPTATVVHLQEAEEPALSGGVPGTGQNDFGPQITVTPGEGGKALLYMSEFSLPEENSTTPIVPGIYEIRGMSVADGSRQIEYGGNPVSVGTCDIGTASNSVAAGSHGVVYALDEGRAETGGGHTAWGFDLIEFGPSGGNCPQRYTSFTINGEKSLNSLQKGQTASLVASTAELHGGEPHEVQWHITGPEMITLAGEGCPSQPKCLTASHQFLKPGSYTIELAMTMSAGSSPPPVVTHIEVHPTSPTASFEVFPAQDGGGLLQLGQSINPGEAVTFNAGESVDPTGGEHGTPTHKLQSYEWSFGDGRTETTTTPDYTRSFVNAGSEARSETVSLVVVNEEGIESTTPAIQMLTIAGTPASGGGGVGTGGGGGSGVGTGGGGVPTTQPDRTPTSVSPSVLAGVNLVNVTVTCPATKTSCTGTIQLRVKLQTKGSPRTRHKSKLETIAQGSFSVAGGAGRRLTIRLNSAGVILLKKEKTLKVEVVVSAHDTLGDPHTQVLRAVLHSSKKTRSKAK